MANWSPETVLREGEWAGRQDRPNYQHIDYGDLSNPELRRVLLNLGFEFVNEPPPPPHLHDRRPPTPEPIERRPPHFQHLEWNFPRDSLSDSHPYPVDDADKPKDVAIVAEEPPKKPFQITDDFVDRVVMIMVIVYYLAALYYAAVVFSDEEDATYVVAYRAYELAALRIGHFFSPAP